MDEKISQIEDLLAMFDEREQIYAEITQIIGDMIESTVLSALYDLFEAPAENVMWIDFVVEDTMLLIMCEVLYNVNEHIPEFINKIAPHEQESEGAIVTRNIRISIPLHAVFLPKKEVMKYLHQMIHHLMVDSGKTSTVQVSETTGGSHSHQFDASKLNKDQVLQMLVFQHHTKGVKH